MTYKTNVRQDREKLFASFVPIYGEESLTKNVNLSNLVGLLEILL